MLNNFAKAALKRLFLTCISAFCKIPRKRSRFGVRRIKRFSFKLDFDHWVSSYRVRQKIIHIKNLLAFSWLPPGFESENSLTCELKISINAIIGWLSYLYAEAWCYTVVVLYGSWRFSVWHFINFQALKKVSAPSTKICFSNGCMSDFRGYCNRSTGNFFTSILSSSCSSC